MAGKVWLFRLCIGEGVAAKGARDIQEGLNLQCTIKQQGLDISSRNRTQAYLVFWYKVQLWGIEAWTVMATPALGMR